MELPECPVCLQSYDSVSAVPRVLPCGHTACETCLKNLPQQYPLTIRCPACTQLVKFPSQANGPSFPKNIDLLRLIQEPTSPKPNKNKAQQAQQVVDFVSPLWTNEFYSAWIGWILLEEAISDGVLKEGNQKVRLFKVGAFGVGNGGVDVFKLSYVAKVMNCLNGMREQEREELGLILRVGSRKCGRVCSVHGLWGDLGDGFLYLVCERLSGGGLDKFGGFENGLNRDDLLSGFAMMCMEICEALCCLHLEGIAIGCLNLSCFEFDGFRRVCLSLSEALVTVRVVWEGVIEAGSGERTAGAKEMGMLVGKFLRREVFVSPEVLFEILSKKADNAEYDCFTHSVGHGSDVWSLSCLLLQLLTGKQFTEVLADYVDHFVSNINEENGLGFTPFYMGFLDKVSSLLESKFGTKFELLQQMLCRSLKFDPGDRPLVIDIWKCIRELIVSIQFDRVLPLGEAVHEENVKHFLVCGELFWPPTGKSEKQDELPGEENDGENQDEVEEMRVYEDFAKGLAKGKVKFNDMQGHLGCVTGLAVGGGFLFSSSFDKSIQVWSLQEFSHLHTFKGHEHKVMAVIYVDEEQPLCISGDSGGGIFLWSISLPLGQEPLRIWYEQKDWRYSGIHALTTADNGYLYTGSGDRSIKAWSLQDGTLACTMEGHRSVVSTLATSDGVLYSGSWDGTIRLWSLCDHSLLTILGEDVPGSMISVLSLTTSQNFLVAALENGHIKVWRKDVFMKSAQIHDGAIFATGLEGKWLFTGGWDNTISVQELCGDELQVDTRTVGSIQGGSVVTALLYWQGKLFVGYGDKMLKVHHLPCIQQSSFRRTS